MQYWYLYSLILSTTAIYYLNECSHVPGTYQYSICININTVFKEGFTVGTMVDADSIY